MDMYINDLSFQGQFKDFEEAVEAFEQLALTINSSKIIRGLTPIRRSKELKNVQVCENKSVHEFLLWLHDKSKISPKHRDVLAAVLNNIVKGPFVDMSALDAALKDLIAPCTKNIENSLIHAALSERYSSFPAVASITKSKGYDCNEILLEAFDRKVLNLFSEDCVIPLNRDYEVNVKHEIKNSKIVNGKMHTKMDLTPEEAQSVLEQGIYLQSKNAIFTFYNDTWYQFPAHVDCKYHGFPIGNPTNNPNINIIIKTIGSPPYPENGYKILS